MSANSSKQPNILVLMVDQLSGEFFPNGPADFLHAPTLKKLSENGVNFDLSLIHI